MEKTSKLKKIAIALLMLILPVLSGCYNDGGGGNKTSNDYNPPVSVSKTKTVVEIADSDYGFVKSEGITDEKDINLENTKRLTTFDVFEEYYLLIEFTMTARSNNDGQSSLELVVTFENAEYFVANIFSADGTDNTYQKDENESQDKDPNTGKVFNNLSLTYFAPKEEDVKRKARVIIKFQPIKANQYEDEENDLRIKFNEMENTSLSGDCGGYLKQIIVKQNQLETPKIELISSTSTFLKWTHVKNAKYYILYMNYEVALDKSNGKPIIYDDVNEQTKVGNQIEWNIESYLMNGSCYQIQACNDDNKNFINSGRSNEVKFM